MIFKLYKCKNCKINFKSIDPPTYCPNCMDEDINNLKFIKEINLTTVNEMISQGECFKCGNKNNCLIKCWFPRILFDVKPKNFKEDDEVTITDSIFFNREKAKVLLPNLFYLTKLDFTIKR